MIHQFLLPDPGEGLPDAEIVTWRVGVGDHVNVNDVVVEVETSKSIVELPSPFEGVVSALHAQIGQIVAVGTPIVSISDGADDDQDVPAVDQSGPGQSGAEPGQRATLVGYGPKTGATSRRRRPQSSERVPIAKAYERTSPSHRLDDVVEPTRIEDVPTGDPLPQPGRAPRESALVQAFSQAPKVKPSVRRYAASLGVSLAGVTGTGPGGTITREDVETAAGFTFGSKASGPARERRIPMSGVRKITAENMERSVSDHVHVTEWVEVDVTATMELVESLKSRREFAGLRISPLLVYAKAICIALSRNPELNTSFDKATNEIIFRDYVNLGIAAATPRGLMVPNIKDAESLNLLELCQEINELVAIAKDGKLQPSHYANGTFTLTNVGIFGIDAGTPIINGAESAILCMGAISRRPWVVGSGAGERIEPRWVTTLTVSFDHRLIDGEQGSSFLSDVAQLLSDPSLAMVF